MSREDGQEDPNGARPCPPAPGDEDPESSSANAETTASATASPDFAALLPPVVQAREREAAIRERQRRQRRPRPARSGRASGRGQHRRLAALAGAGVLGLGVAAAGAFLLGRYHDALLPAPTVTAATGGVGETMGDSASEATEQLDIRARREVERLLAALNLPVGPVDGHIDAQSRAAIRSYLEMQGLPPRPAAATPALLEDLRQVVGFMAEPVPAAR